MDALASPGARRGLKLNRTLRSPYLKHAQRRHAQGVVVLTSLGLLLAACLIAVGAPVGPAEIGIFLCSFVLVGLGSAIGYHRHFTHRSFKTSTPLRAILAVLGSMAGQGTVIFWVSLHRRHHANADQAGDPHSPYIGERGERHKSFLYGLWHSYIGWTFDHDVPNAAYYARDLIKDRVIARINQLYPVWVLLGLLLPALAGGLLRHSLMGALSGLVWGGLIRIFVWHNMIWCITSISHIFGSRDFESGDQSTNNIWLAIPTLGESWHNNHHAFPTAAILRLRWYQLDLSGLLIRALEAMGLVWDVGRPTARMLEEKERP